MEYISTKEASEKWGISTIRITVLANEGRIPGAYRLGRNWLIPANATKPPELKANHSGSAQKKTKERNQFSFPLYHFRPDWSSVKEEQLTEQQKHLLSAETAVLECRFLDAYHILKTYLSAPDDIYTEVGSLCNAGICCIALNKPNDFSKIFLRLQVLLSEDFPHKEDLMVVLDILNTYADTIASAAQKSTYNTELHEQSLPLAYLTISYDQLSKELMNPGTVDTTLLELSLRFLEKNSSLIVMEMLHCHLMGIYYLRHDMTSAEKHAKQIVQIAYENKYYYPLVTYYNYFSSVLSPILSQYPEEFQNHCNKLFSQYEENFAGFASSIEEYSVMSKITNVDYPYIFAILMDLSNAQIAERLGISPRTVNRKLQLLCEKFHVNSKKVLKDYLLTYM